MATVAPTTLDLNLLHKIVVDAAAAHTVEQQIERLVVQVRAAMAVDVCTLYQLADDKVLHAVANQGLAENAVGGISLPLGAGLVGLIAESLLPLNLSNARDHPNFVPIAGIGEENLRAYLGVPIVSLGNLIGVIVVQRQQAEAFSPTEESFLITIAAQLAGSLLRLPAIAASRSALPGRKINGISGAPGKAIGEIRLVLSSQTLQMVDEPAYQGVAAELRLLREAVRVTREELSASRRRLAADVSADVLQLFDFYGQMLESDVTLTAQRKVEAGASAFAAVRSTIDDQVAAFEAIPDEYLRARGEDVRHLGNQVLEAILGHDVDAAAGAANLVLLGDMISITDIASYQADQLAGIVCMQGSALSHTAILARALGLPAVMGTGLIDHINNGDRLIVDGDLGEVVLEPAQLLVDAYRSIIAESETRQHEMLAGKDLPAVTTDGRLIRLLSNTGLLADITPGLQRGAEGVGLYRSEIPFLTRATMPTEAEQLEVYRHVLQTYHPLPVTIRTLDIGGDKQLPYLPVAEANPSLGWRGIRFALDNRPILATQLRAILRANHGLGNLRLMLPMISEVAEVATVAELLTVILAQLAEQGEIVPRPDLGIMVEVPGVVPLLPHLVEWIDFVSVGSNDLTQYMLAVDRGNPRVSAYYDSLHPGVLHCIQTTVQTCREAKLEVSVCGEMASDPVAAVLLVAMGVDCLSMSAFYLPAIRSLIRRISLAHARQVLATALTLSSARDIRALVEDAMFAADRSSAPGA